MANLASVDRLNILYFGEMELPDAEKKMRIVMSGTFQDIVRKYYDTVHAIIADEKTDKRRKDILLAAAVVSLRKAYLGFFDKYYERYVAAIFQGGEPYYGTAAWRDKHALDFAVWLTRTARNEPNVAFENSHSIAVARTEVNAVGNLAALDAAYRSGKRFKTWVTFGDSKVRPSHKAVDGERIPIDEAFTVGGYKLMFPNDTSLGADAEEIVNCRCTLKFDDGKFLTNGNERGIMRVGSGRVTVSSIDSPIEQKHTGKGNPNAIMIFDVPLNNRQQALLDVLSEYDSQITVSRNSVNMADLSALTAKTGVEFAMFTKGSERLIIRGNERMVNIDVEQAKKLAAQGYKWSGHTHPGNNLLCMTASDGDHDILRAFGQKTSVIYNSKGQYAKFSNEE